VAFGKTNKTTQSKAPKDLSPFHTVGYAVSLRASDIVQQCTQTYDPQVELAAICANSSGEPKRNTLDGKTVLDDFL
jgi:hypothetical protein